MWLLLFEGLSCRVLHVPKAVWKKTISYDSCCFTSLPSFAGTLCMHVAILVVPRFGAFWASSVHFVLLTTTWLLPQRIIASSTLWRHVQLNSAAPCVWAHATVHRVRWCALCNLHARPFWTCAQTAQLSFSAPSLSLTWGVASVWFSRWSIMLAELQFSTVRLDTLRLLQLLWRSYLRRRETGHFVWACMSSSGSYCLTCPVIV